MVGTERTDFIDRYKTTTMIFSNLDRFLGYFYISDLHSDIPSKQDVFLLLS